MIILLLIYWNLAFYCFSIAFPFIVKGDYMGYLSGDLIKHSVKFTEFVIEVERDYSDLTKDMTALLESGTMDQLNVAAGLSRICEAVKECENDLGVLNHHLSTLHAGARKWEIEETVEAQREYVASLTELDRSFVKLDNTNKELFHLATVLIRQIDRDMFSEQVKIIEKWLPNKISEDLKTIDSLILEGCGVFKSFEETFNKA
jgi:DNA repair ATPase RecN